MNKFVSLHGVEPVSLSGEGVKLHLSIGCGQNSPVEKKVIAGLDFCS